uniref:AAA family ATPase n=1 Tax=Candidatus Desulfatibia profunda TaxID=2841695 RepID=A0A8J6NQ19_9BACT|nr:AAA family ATPase [Candidatus Desulfatibia profunda]
MIPQASPYQDLFVTLDELRKRTARFRRVALHIHSPDSHDWNRTGDKTLNDRERLLAPSGEVEFINTLKKHFDLVVITDHMKCTYADRVSNASLYEKDFIVLPGMEVNFQPEAAISCSRLHILVIFHEGSTVESMSRIFAGLKNILDDASRTGNEVITGLRLEEFIKRIHKEDGICIAAHVNSQQGIRHHFRQTANGLINLLTIDPATQEEQEKKLSDELKDYLLNVGLDALEISKATDVRHYRWASIEKGHKVSIPVTMRFDAHCIEDFARPNLVTWVKMTSLGLKGLRDAFKFPETRIRFTSDLPTPPSPLLLGLEIVGEDKSLFENERIAFAENLNCLIGPRGSGKSTIVESLRYVFGYNRTLSELDSTNKLSERIREMQKANLTGCLIRVVYQTQAGDRRVLEATFDPQEDYATRVFTANGDQLSVADVESSGDYPMRLFGWSEIETLGRDTARQRDLLDRLIIEMPPAKQERNNLRQQLQANRKDVEKILNELNTICARQNGIIRRYSEYKDAFEKLNTEEVKKRFGELDLAQMKGQVLLIIKQNVDSFSVKVDELDPNSLREGLTELLQKAPQSLRDWWLTDATQKLKILDSETNLQKYLSSATQVLKGLSELLGQHIDVIKNEIDTIQSQIRASFADDSSMQKIADLRTNAERRLREVSAVRDEYLKEWKRLQDALTAREQIADQLIQGHDRIAGIRARHNEAIETRLNQYFAGHMKISLRFQAGHDTRQFIEEIIRFKVASAFATQYKNRRIPEILAAHFNPVTLAQAHFACDASVFAGRQLPDDPSAKITTAEAQKATDLWRPWAMDDAAQVESLQDNGARLTKMMTLQETEWDDEESILLNDRPVGELSPGQRSSAMLPLIALAEATPLVIDQPEDNLDNRLIGQVLAEILGALKEKRQIIVCTHNPNIVVSGDAEQVIVLDAISDRKAKVEKHGSIDNEDIVQSVIDIMEGGRDAFRVRQHRYGMDLPSVVAAGGFG